LKLTVCLNLALCESVQFALRQPPLVLLRLQGTSIQQGGEAVEPPVARLGLEKHALPETWFLSGLAHLIHSAAGTCSLAALGPLRRGQSIPRGWRRGAGVASEPLLTSCC